MSCPPLPGAQGARVGVKFDECDACGVLLVAQGARPVGTPLASDGTRKFSVGATLSDCEGVHVAETEQ